MASRFSVASGSSSRTRVCPSESDSSFVSALTGPSFATGVPSSDSTRNPVSPSSPRRSASGVRSSVRVWSERSDRSAATLATLVFDSSRRLSAVRPSTPSSEATAVRDNDSTSSLFSAFNGSRFRTRTQPARSSSRSSDNCSSGRRSSTPSLNGTNSPSHGPCCSHSNVPQLSFSVVAGHCFPQNSTMPAPWAPPVHTVSSSQASRIGRPNAPQCPVVPHDTRPSTEKRKRGCSFVRP